MDNGPQGSTKSHFLILSRLFLFLNQSLTDIWYSASRFMFQSLQNESKSPIRHWVSQPQLLISYSAKHLKKPHSIQLNTICAMSQHRADDFFSLLMLDLR